MTANNKSTIRRRIGCAAATAALFAGVDTALADESGISFWLPGQYGSLAAVPQTPGWALGVVDYHTSIAGSGNVAAAREIQVGRFSPTVNVNLNLNLAGQGDLVVLAPSYTFATPVFGGQLAVSVSSWFGRSSASIAGSLTTAVGADCNDADRNARGRVDFIRRHHPDRDAALESGRQQFHDLRHRRYSLRRV
jgi:hypothetical protein